MISEFINDLFKYSFLQNAMSISVLLGIACGLIGCFIVLRGLSLMSDAISHAVLPGVALSYLLKVSYFFGATVFGILAALGIGFIKQRSKIKTDASIGIVFSAFLALGILMVTKIQSAINLNNILFGNVLTITEADRNLSIGIASLVILLCILFFKELQITSFDPVMAKISGLPVQFIEYLLILMLTLITVVSLQTVGVILVVSLLITPAATAYLLTNDLKVMMGISASIGAVSAAIGLFLSSAYNIPSGVSIVLTASTFFMLVFLFNSKSGILRKHTKHTKSRI